MNETKQAYPLSWPHGWKRIGSPDRKFGHFNKKQAVYRDGKHAYNATKDLSVFDGIERILESLNRMGVDRQDTIISTNIRTRLDGLPRSGERAPEDPGAAVYWRESPSLPMRCMAIDRYTTVADNLAAIGATLEAMRAIERHGGAEILDRAFTGFSALPAKASSAWREIIQVTDAATMADVDTQFKMMAKKLHPDSGIEPDEDKFRDLIQAREDARKEFGVSL